jgi:formylmethanofuran dehydrogenase subunit A
MMTQTETPSIWERERRAQKLSKLLDAADRVVREGGLDPHYHAAGIYESWTKAQPEHFARLALLAAVRPPSEVTKLAFLDALAIRAGVS